MKPDNATDPIFRMLDHLPKMEPDFSREERIRKRCHAALDRQRQQLLQTEKRAAFLARILEVGFAAAAGFYLLEVVSEALRLAQSFSLN